MAKVTWFNSKSDYEKKDSLSIIFRWQDTQGVIDAISAGEKENEI